MYVCVSYVYFSRWIKMRCGARLPGSFVVMQKLQKKTHSKSYKQIFCCGINIEKTRRDLDGKFFHFVPKELFVLAVLRIQTDVNEGNKKLTKVKSLLQLSSYFSRQPRRRSAYMRYGGHVIEKGTLIAFITRMHFNSFVEMKQKQRMEEWTEKSMACISCVKMALLFLCAWAYQR